MKSVILAVLVMAINASWSHHIGERSKRQEEIFFPGSVRSKSLYQPEEKQEIPLAIIREINEVGVNSINDFMNKFVEAPPDISENDSSVVGIRSRIGVDDDVERSVVKGAKLATCSPELRTIPLVSEKDTTVFYYPSCTRLYRCGGCCGHHLLSCQPVESEIIHLSVIAVDYRGGSHLKFRNKEVVGVEQHKKCKCDCKIQPEHCTKYQRYNKDKCSCECGNTDDELKCRKDRRTKLWNKDLCSCVCKEELECGSGFFFDPFHCSCQPLRSQRTRVGQRGKPWNIDFKREYYTSESRDARNGTGSGESIVFWRQ